MGKVFSRYELENGLYPKNGAHQLAAEDFMMKMSDLQAEYGKGAPQDYMVFGSVSEKRENIRSDLDVLIIRSDEFALNALFNVLVDINERYHVQVEPTILAQNQAESGVHHLASESLYVRYLRSAQKTSGFVVGKPADLISLKYAEPDNQRELLDYFEAKAGSFQVAIPSSTTDIGYHRYQRALELPSKINQKFRYVSEKHYFDENDDYITLRKQNQAYSKFLQGMIEDGNLSARALEQYDLFTRCEYPGALARAAILSLAIYTKLNTDDYLREEISAGKAN